jgi:hypothetical protein
VSGIEHGPGTATVPGTATGSTEERWVPALLTMARELWVLKDRQRVLEELLAAKGVVAPGEADAWQPDPGRQAAIDGECQAFVQRLVAEILPRAPREGRDARGAR